LLLSWRYVVLFGNCLNILRRNRKTTPLLSSIVKEFSMTRDSRIIIVIVLLCTGIVVAAQYYFSSQLARLTVASTVAQKASPSPTEEAITATATPEASVKATPRGRTATASATPRAATPVPTDEDIASPSPTE
jgi:hypothetical protein